MTVSKKEEKNIKDHYLKSKLKNRFVRNSIQLLQFLLQKLPILVLVFSTCAPAYKDSMKGVNMSYHNVKWRLTEFVSKILTTFVALPYIAK